MEYEGNQKLQPSSSLAERLRLFKTLHQRHVEVSAAKDPTTPGQDLMIRLADGKTVKGSAGVTTPLQVAKNERVKGAVVGRVNGELWELGRPLVADCELQLLGFDSVEGRQAVWRTGACVLASVLENGLNAEVCREGASDTGLYCDYLLQNNSLSLMEVEQRCKEMAAVKMPITKLEVTVEELREIFQDSAVRLQLAEEQMMGNTVTVYRCGESIGVCSGVLLPHTGFLKAFKMLQMSPVTLSGSTEASGIMRMIGVAFPGERERDEWEREQEEAKKRDHRRIGKTQELFFFHDVSPGSCFFMPKGAHIYNTLTDFIKSEYRRRGFSEVVTPTLYSTSLWERSGHWEHYSENMFTVTC